MLLTERRIERRLLATRALLGSAHATASETDGQPVLSVVPVVPVATSDNADAESGAEGGTHSPREVGLPRLEVLAERLKLDAFEKRMILLLIGI